MSPIRTNTHTERRNRPSDFDRDRVRRQIAADGYWNNPWFQSKDGLLVGGLPPMTPEPGRRAAWESRQQIAYHQRLQAGAAKGSKSDRTDEGGDSAMVDSDQLASIHESATNEQSDGWSKFVAGDKGTCDNPVEVLNDEDDADIEMKDTLKRSSSPCEQQRTPIKSEEEPKNIKIKRGPISPEKANSETKRSAISSILAGAPSAVPRALAPSIPVRRSASEQLHPQAPDSSTAKGVFLHAAQNRKYPRYTWWRVCGKDSFDLAYADLENPNSTLNLAKRDRRWRVIQLGAEGMQTLVKSGPTRPGRRRQWERHCRVEKKTMRRTI